MKRVQDIGIDEYIKSMQEFTEQIKNMDKDELISILIDVGVLDSDGKIKEQICTGKFYG